VSQVQSPAIPVLDGPRSDVEAARREGEYVLSVPLLDAPPPWINHLRSFTSRTSGGLAVMAGNVLHGDQHAAVQFNEDTRTFTTVFRRREEDAARERLERLVADVTESAERQAARHDAWRRQAEEQDRRAEAEAGRLREKFRRGEDG
jgi:hypothetical protein